MIEQCTKCALFNSLGCPYGYEIGSTQEDCDEFRPSEELENLTAEEKADKAYYDLACEVEDLRAENERLRAEKKRGYWFTDYARQPMVVCSNCNLSNNSNRSKYCPHCGARMDGK